MAAVGGKAVIGLDSIQHGLSDNEHLGYARCSIVQFTSTPSLPNLIRQFLINQEGFYVDFGEHGLKMDCS